MFKIFRRLLYILRAALVVGLMSFARSLVGLVNAEVRHLSFGTERLPPGHPYHALLNSHVQLQSFLPAEQFVVEQLPERVQPPQIEVLNDNSDKEDTAIFRLPPEMTKQNLTLRLSANEFELLQRVRKQEGADTDEATVIRALTLFAEVSPKMRRGYILRLERAGSGPKVSFIYE